MCFAQATKQIQNIHCNLVALNNADLLHSDGKLIKEQAYIFFVVPFISLRGKQVGDGILYQLLPVFLQCRMGLLTRLVSALYGLRIAQQNDCAPEKLYNLLIVQRKVCPCQYLRHRCEWALESKDQEPDNEQ